MDIGSAIKILRKQRNISQKELANKCGLSTNSICNIENNISFPQKSTITKICQTLNIPSAYLLFFALSEDDIPVEKREIFNVLKVPLNNVL